MGPTRDDFEIWKGVKSIATKLSQVHNRKIYSFILRMIPGPGPGTNLSLSSPRPCPTSQGAADPSTTSMSMTQNYLSPQQSRHPASAYQPAIWKPVPLFRFQPKSFIYCSCSSSSAVCGANHRHATSWARQDPGSPHQAEDHHGTSPGRH